MEYNDVKTELDPRVQVVFDQFDELGLSKGQLLKLLALTLTHGGLTDDQIEGIVNDWRYMKDQI